MKVERKIKLIPQEKIVTLARRYWFTLLWWWLLVFLLFAVPFFFMFWLFNHGRWGQALFIVPLTLGFLVFIRTWFLWQKNVLVITNHRIVDIDQRGFFEQIISDIPYDQIEDVKGRISGFFGTVFRYGDVVVQTANGRVEIVVDRVKQPTYVQQEINEMRERYLSRSASSFKGDVVQAMIDKLYELELPELMQVEKVLKKRLSSSHY